MTRYASELPDFGDLLRATSDALNLPVWIVEKDYYVTRALRTLRDHIGDQFLFKGGTSLSKGWNLIERFSEDIDLLFRRDQGGTNLSKNELDRRFKKAEELIRETPGFTYASHTSGKGVRRESLFTYLATHAPIGPVSDKVKLEMGCRGGIQPNQSRNIRSFIGDFVAGRNQTDLADDLGSFDVLCLDVTRTFLEKLFAVHAAFTKDRAAGRTRHYYDLYQLAGLPEVQAFVVGDDFATVFADVRHFSLEHWPAASILPETGIAQSPALAPDSQALGELTRNYAAERILFFHEPPAMTAILERLRQLPFRP
jgi:predicted nucleotidyltransferase component of viral defense system